MENTDIDTVVNIAQSTWGVEYYESPEVFQQRLDWWPAGCWMYENNGYLISHPSQVRYPPKLNRFLKYDYTDCYHIHDINLLPEIRGQGIAEQILSRFYDWPVVTLVAANNTESYWANKGFKEKSNFEYGTHMVKNDYRNRHSN